MKNENLQGKGATHDYIGITENGQLIDTFIDKSLQLFLSLGF